MTDTDQEITINEAVPTTANRPDYKSVTPKLSQDEQLRLYTKSLFPDDTYDSFDDDEDNNIQRRKHKQLQELVFAQVKSHYVNGGPKIINPARARAEVTGEMVLVIRKRPDLIDAALVQKMTATLADESSEVRSYTLRSLETVARQRSELLDSAVVKKVTEIAANEPDSGVRNDAFKTLAAIAEKRPDLIDAQTVQVIAKAAAEPVKDVYWNRECDDPDAPGKSIIIREKVPDDLLKKWNGEQLLTADGQFANLTWQNVMSDTLLPEHSSIIYGDWRLANPIRDGMKPVTGDGSIPFVNDYDDYKTHNLAQQILDQIKDRRPELNSGHPPKLDTSTKPKASSATPVKLSHHSAKVP